MGVMKEFTIDMILKIEDALNIKLYQSQIDYLLFGDMSGFKERRSGYTTIYIVKLLLTNNNLYKSELLNGTYCDLDPKEYTHYKYYFKREFIIIREKLLSAGFSVAGLI